MKQSETTTDKEPKKIRLRDLISVDYTDGSWPEDEQGELAYDYFKRASGTLDEEDLDESGAWIDGYVDDYTKMSYNPKDEVLTLTWRNYEKFPKDVKLDKASWEMLMKSQNRSRTFNQLWMSGKIKVIKEDSALEEAYETQVSKYELNIQLKRVTDRIKFLRSANHGSALPKDVAVEIKKLEDSKDSIISMLKEEDILEDVDELYITEALNMLQRMKRRAIMRRNKGKILAGRRRAQRRRASTSVLQQRAMRAARASLARRLLRKSKGEASYGEKVRVEKMLASRQGAIKNIARRLLSKVRQKERQRFQKRATPPTPIQPVKPNK
jgi:hypothetical protein